MASQEPVVRPATKEDIPCMLSMIRELAHYEKALDRVEATEESLASSLTFAACASDPEPKAGYAKTLLLVLPAASGSPPPPPVRTTATTTDFPERIHSPNGDEVCGMALYFHNYSTWLATPGVYLEDLFVRPTYRRRGYATILLKSLGKIAAEVSGGKGRLEWSCLRWNESALQFYDWLGGERMEEWIGIRVEGSEKLLKMREAPKSKAAGA